MSVMFFRHCVFSSETSQFLSESRMCLVEKKKSVVDQFEVKHRSETYYWTQKLIREDYGVNKTWVILVVVKE